MTSEERSRAKKLEKLLGTYEKGVSQKTFIIIFLAIMAVVYSIVFAVGGKEIIFIHVIILGTFLLIFTTDTAGDTSLATRAVDFLGAQVIGKNCTGPFLCTLPFKAKDLLSARLSRLEVSITVASVSSVAVNVASVLTNSPAEEYLGFCAAIVVFMELGALLVTFMRNFKSRFFLQILFFVSVVDMAMETVDSEGTTYRISNSFEFLSGWAGVAVLVLAPIIISAAGEIYLKNKKDPSWHLR